MAQKKNKKGIEMKSATKGDVSEIITIRLFVLQWWQQQKRHQASSSHTTKSAQQHLHTNREN